MSLPPQCKADKVLEELHSINISQHIILVDYDNFFNREVVVVVQLIGNHRMGQLTGLANRY